MPGTDVGSAPQESWHNHMLKCHCKPSMKTPYTLARALESKVVQGQVQVLKHMSQHGEKLQDWPHIGQFTDQHTYGNNTALAKEGRSSGQTLLAWGRHLRLADSDGTVWMLVPASRLKTDWHVQATSVDAVELALQDLKSYDVKEKHFTNWRAAAKTFDFRPSGKCLLASPQRRIAPARRSQPSHGMLVLVLPCLLSLGAL